ncbi:hypothetical protein DFP94_1011110 [Fontibacillus phaseoli]|uniref:Uncharacterized protein n=1 Tax=Fontibacillus phaseoli TaxID=1416533 RepID=A0A369BQ45_9BACL|nr:hypothetical protein DFP94_1011110 [Fontibacillus phaseoli]
MGRKTRCGLVILLLIAVLGCSALEINNNYSEANDRLTNLFGIAQIPNIEGKYLHFQLQK